jgi:hypothetical protein
MASIISAGTTSGTALNMSGDTSGNLAFQTQAGTYTITVPNETGTILTNKTSGTILQVLQAVKTDTFSTSSTSYVDITGLSVSITPKFSTSKILVMYQLNTGVDTAIQGIFMQLVRNSTPIFVGDAAGSRPQTTATNGITNAYGVLEMGGSYLDSPATTSSTTYKIQMMVNGGSPYLGYVNRGVNDRNTSLYDARTASSIIVMEVAG